MASISPALNRDLRSENLCVSYSKQASSEEEVDIGNVLSSLLPMAALIMRNKIFSWLSLILAIQTFLSDNMTKKSDRSIMGLMMAFMALTTHYLPLFLPPAQRASATGSTTAATP